MAGSKSSSWVKTVPSGISRRYAERPYEPLRQAAHAEKGRGLPAARDDVRTTKLDDRRQEKVTRNIVERM
jgi:hypothetical protein